MSEHPGCERNPHPLARYRQRHKLTLAEFAIRVPTTESTMSRIENGVRQPTIRMVRLLVAATGGEVSADDIINAHVAPCEAGRQ